MARRILVPLDGSDYSKVATKVAIEMAKKSDGIIIGMGVVDTEEIDETAIGAGIGASYYAEHLKTYKKNKAIGKIKNFLDEFEDDCIEAKVDYERYSKSGDPVEEIIDMGKTSDLIITGLRTFFHFETTPEPGDTLRELLESGVCPVLAVPKEYIENNKKVVIAYDDTISSSKAMKMFQRFYKTNPYAKKVYLLNVNDDLDKADEILKSAKQYFKSHKIRVDLEKRAGKPGKEILNFAKNKKVNMIVMGAYGEGGLSKLFFGHASRGVIEDGSIPVFVYH
ncbi:MAG: universal stress protein [Acidobacteriota bacterium]